MSGTPDASLTLYSILNDNWNAANVGGTTPYFNTPAGEKRLPAETQDTISIYSTAGQQPKRAITNDYYDRTDTVTLDVVTFVSLDRMMLLRTEVDRILNLAAVRSSPSTRPLVSAGDSYNADGYDQIVPVSHRTMEDVNRQWWRTTFEVECKAYYVAR